MPLVKNLTRIDQRLKQQAFNSSHGVWCFADLQFFESSNDWIFAFTLKAGAVLLALEPLPPLQKPIDQSLFESFGEAWAEFKKQIPAKCYSWIAIGKPFLNCLYNQGFESICVAKEPWVEMDQKFGNGNKSKGVRSAKNQAIRSGIEILDLSQDQMLKQANLRHQMNGVLSSWKNKKILRVDGFLEKSDPFFKMNGRHFIFAFLNQGTQKNLVAYLVLTPIYGQNAYFLEDLVYTDQSPRGVGELLTWEALSWLKEKGATQASLGVVSMLEVQSDPNKNLGYSQHAIRVLSKIAKHITSPDGLELFRKRFKPNRWDLLYFAVGAPDKSPPKLGHWARAVWGLFLAFEPKHNLNFESTLRPLKKYLSKHPYSSVLPVLTIGIFVILNQDGLLPQSVQKEFGFSTSAPFYQWIYRTVTNDFLHKSTLDLIVSTVWTTLALFWAETKQNKRFLGLFVVGCIFFDDWLTYHLILKPALFLNLKFSASLFESNEVGCSLLGFALVGLQSWKLRHGFREIFVALVLLFSFLGLAVFSSFPSGLLLDLDTLLLFTLGLIVGKFEMAYSKSKNCKVALQKAPVVTRIKAYTNG